MPVGGVVDDEVDQDPDAAAPGLVDELDEVAQGPVARVDAVEVGDVVAVVAGRARLGGGQPHRVDAEAVEVVEPAGEPCEVAAAVAVVVEEGLDVDAVDDGILEPEVADHAAALPEPRQRQPEAAGRSKIALCRSTEGWFKRCRSSPTSTRM